MIANQWSQKAWSSIEDIYNAILTHPFIKELSEGTLPIEKFLYYLGQDAHYLDTYCRMLAHTASRLSEKEDIETFLNFASVGISVERELHQSFLKGMTLPEVSPSCLLYSTIEKSTALEPVCVEVASLLPCFWVYQKVGEYILSSTNNLKNNPYAQWILTYGDESFAASTRKAIDICNRLAEQASDEERSRMSEVFRLCSKMEWMFWDSAYNLEKWKI